METILLTFGFLVAIIFLMSIGFIVKGKTLKGSCGGITALGMKKACDCDEPCDNLQKKLDAGDEAAKAEYEEKFAKKSAQFYEVK
ncbi:MULTISPECIES: (Na+)-NQR maturation NqrM [Glaesserella]|uniref:(Na+)-NQR maturation NqrM n=1 Tax=Glaesserella australis TaxID=2094024 RepID=A0A328C0E2_9PAST|nr:MULTISPECIES: (Na+)-NQR maturation NqrM [Glaesserella]AUI66225.1 hypothetical protein CJD39_06355 [Glaesserella sp. 15-184]RAL19247.1 hypothetical protein C5N92_03780 [Glaesserella australis]